MEYFFKKTFKFVFIGLNINLNVTYIYINLYSKSNVYDCKIEKIKMQ